MTSLRRRSHSIPLVVAVLTFAGLAACAAPRSTNHRVPMVQRSERQSGGLEVLTTAHLGAAGPDLSLYEALARLRPVLLEGPIGRPEGPFPVVYIEGRRLSDSQRLRHLSSERVRKVQILSGALATRRYGAGHEGGAILVSVVPERR
jgi:hypothetical protein